MSASREKKKRLDVRAEGGQNKHQPEASGVLKKRLQILCGVLVVLLVAALVVIGLGIPQRYIIAATIEGEDISVVELNYHLVSQTNAFVQSNSYILQIYGVDFSKPLSSQVYDEETGMSWGDYMLNITFNTLDDTVLFSHLAADEGIMLTDKDRQDIEKNMESLRQGAALNNMSTDKYLSRIYGRGMTTGLYRQYLERTFLATRYSTYHRDSFTFTESDIQSYYDENSKDYDTVTYRQMALDRTLSDEEFDAAVEAGEDLETLVETDIGEITMEEKLAYDKARKLADDPNLTPENFNELAKPLTPEDRWEYYDEDPDFAKFTDQSYSEGVAEVMDWLYEPEREYGDVTVIGSANNFTTVMFLGRTQNTQPTKTLRHILIQSSGDNDSTNSAAVQAGNIYNPIAGGVSESEFAKLADEHSQDYTNLEPGGLLKEIGLDTFDDEEINDWLFDESRKGGDLTMIENDDGFHILYFVETGRPGWQVEVESTLRENAYEEFQSEKTLASGNPIRNEFGIAFVVEV